MGLAAYQQTQTRTETPRDLEYRLFAQVTLAMMDLKAVPKSDLARWIDILDWNRRVWSFFSNDCLREGNQLPQALRASIVSLAIWVGKYTSEVMRGQGDIDDLIDINRTIMQGLSSAAQPQSAAA
jgi:flagellar biosynthesis activator protein FlaF